MKLFVTLFVVAVAAVSAQQQQLDPSYLRQYYAQVAQQSANGQGHQRSTPIFEPQEQAQPQYSAPKQNYPRPAQPQPHYAQEQRARQFAPQEIQYQQQQQQARPQQLKPKRPFQQQQEEDELDYDQNASYQFGFDVKDDEFTNYQNRKEQRDGGVIKGSYSVVDSDGFIRTVNYVADPKEGFKAEVVREPTDIVVKIPTPKAEEPQTHGFRQAAKQQPQQYQQQQPSPQQYRPAPQQHQSRPDYSQYQQ